MPKKIPVNPLQQMIDKSIEELRANSKAMEAAVEKVLAENNMLDISEAEFLEIEKLNNTLNAVDDILYSMERPQEPVKKAKKRRRRTKRRR